MKKINIIIQAALFVLIAGLYILYFTGKKNNNTSTASSEADTTSVKMVNTTIAYVDLDTVIANYQMTRDLTDEITKKGKQFESELASKSKNFQSGVEDLKYKANKGLELRSKLEEMQQQLAIEEQNLYRLRDSYQIQIEEEKTVMLRKVLNNIMEYMKEYNKTKNYHYILGNSFDGKILFADKTLDITQDVLKGLNEKYNAEKGAAKKK